ncbi:MAG TPA: ParA family protein [Chloroflexota bacterium]
MPVFAVVNQMSGVGKTTTAVNLASALGPVGAPSLLVDCDPQGDASANAGQGITTIGVYGALINGDLAACVAPTAAQQVDLMMSSPRLRHLEYHLRRRTEAVETRLRDVLTPIRSTYTHIFLDCPSDLGLLTINALIAADAVIVPVRASEGVMDQFGELRETLERIRREHNPTLHVFGVLIAMYDGRLEESREAAAMVKQRYPQLAFNTRIPYDPAVHQAAEAGEPLVLHEPTSAAARAYNDLTREFAGRLSFARV